MKEGIAFTRRLRAVRSMWFGFAAASMLAWGLAVRAPLVTAAATDPPVKPKLDWYRSTIVKGYEQAGQKNSRWDSKATSALESYLPIKAGMVTDSKSDEFETFRARLKEAIAADCDDPYIQYLHLRFVPRTPPLEKVELANEYTRLVPRMRKTGYPALCKYYVTLRGSAALAAAQRSTPPIVHDFRRAAVTYLGEMLNDPRIPAIEVDEALETLYEAMERNAGSLDHALQALEGRLTGRWDKLAAAHLFMGKVHIKLAWNERGAGLADTVTEHGWEGLAEHLEKAERALERAWALDPKDSRAAVQMLTVELGQGKGRARMEQWFQRAMALDPANQAACAAKLYYLEPKWYGSAEDLLAFGHECVASKVWKGRVPLILADAHQALARYLRDPEKRKAYWKNAEVWKDVKLSFERFFELNPAAADWHHNYAKYAYQCEQWDELNRQLKLLGEVNYQFFGGEEAFEKMVRQAKEHASP